MLRDVSSFLVGSVSFLGKLRPVVACSETLEIFIIISIIVVIIISSQEENILTGMDLAKFYFRMFSAWNYLLIVRVIIRAVD